MFLLAVPLEDQTAEQVTKVFVDHIVLMYGIPQVILSDSGSQFLSETLRACANFRYSTHSTSIRPQSNGSKEHSHKSLIEYFKSYVAAE